MSGPRFFVITHPWFICVRDVKTQRPDFNDCDVLRPLDHAVLKYNHADGENASFGVRMSKPVAKRLSGKLMKELERFDMHVVKRGRVFANKSGSVLKMEGDMCKYRF